MANRMNIIAKKRPFVNPYFLFFTKKIMGAPMRQGFRAGERNESGKMIFHATKGIFSALYG